MSLNANNKTTKQCVHLLDFQGRMSYAVFFLGFFLPKSTTNSACFISISNIAHAKYKLSQALLLNYEKSL